MIWYKKKCLILNTIADKTIDADKEQNIIVNKKFITIANEAINANIEQDTIASK